MSDSETPWSVHGILQARILEWIAIPFSGDLPDPGMEPRSPALQADSLPFELPRKYVLVEYNWWSQIKVQIPVGQCHSRGQYAKALEIPGAIMFYVYLTSLGVALMCCLQSCPTLCDIMDHSPPGSSLHGILQARYWSGLPFPPAGDLPHAGIKAVSLMTPALTGGFFTTSTTWEVLITSFMWLFELYTWFMNIYLL